MSTNNQKHRIRAAVTIANRYERRSKDFNIQLPSDTWKVCIKRLNTLQVAVEKGWGRAATLCQRRLAIDVLHCAEQLEFVSAQLPSVLPSLPTCKSIYDELLAMELEFRADQI